MKRGRYCKLPAIVDSHKRAFWQNSHLSQRFPCDRRIHRNADRLDHLEASDVRRLKELEQENDRLQRLPADLSFDSCVRSKAGVIDSSGLIRPAPSEAGASC